MIWIDFTLIGLIFIFFVSGLLRGFTKEVFSLVFWMLAIWVSLMFSREFSGFLESTISPPSVRMVASFVALFAITLSLGGLIGFLLSVLAKKTGLTFMDRFGGMVFGAVRGMIVVTVVVILAGLTPLPKDSWWTESTLLPPFQLLAVWLRDHLSSGMAEYISYR
ncbi:membrane protein required for colicin V production [Methylobacter tundripaludum]|uniref:Membrane protein required for colicin V production n=1 Tax=Methylobacter tundripaludum TaxID=173365 RepID=A0A2S6HG97_9GAMM|nr:CvpA family protein [Methylobacter tundripaludum]PPK76507.1 membrane protein required for colicin V production [Methylobacter tundripaludum]